MPHDFTPTISFGISIRNLYPNFSRILTIFPPEFSSNENFYITWLPVRFGTGFHWDVFAELHIPKTPTIIVLRKKKLEVNSLEPLLNFVFLS